jgi:alkyl hydroperoxide reductase subunit AhpC
VDDRGADVLARERQRVVGLGSQFSVPASVIERIRQNAQLRAFQRADDSLTETGIKVAALSVDDEPTTAELIAKHGLTFPVGHSADAAAIASLTGAFVNPDPVFLQYTGFVLDPTGKVVVSVYSSGAIGRLVPEDVIGLVRYLREHAAA